MALDATLVTAVDRWNIARPTSGRVPGVRMAGFEARSDDPIDLEAIPFPAVTVMVDLGSEPFVVADAGGRRHRRSLTIGMAPDRVRAQGRNIRCLQIRLSPVVAHTVFDGASASATGELVALDDLWGREGDRIEAQLREAGGWAERFAIVEEAIARRYDQGRAVTPDVAQAWSTIVRSGGQARVESLAADAGVSRKLLWTRFRAQVGLSPKRAAALVRFDRAAHDLAAGRPIAQVAADHGYADQSHMHRDTAIFAGSTPAAVANAAWLAVDHVAWPTR